MNLKEVANGLASKEEKMNEGMDADMAKQKAKMHLNMAKECLEVAGLDAAQAIQEMMEEPEGDMEMQGMEQEEEASAEGMEEGEDPKAMIMAVLKKKQAQAE